MKVQLLDGVVIDMGDHIKAEGNFFINVPEEVDVKIGYIYDSINKKFLTGDYSDFINRLSSREMNLFNLKTHIENIIEDLNK